MSTDFPSPAQLPSDRTETGPGGPLLSDRTPLNLEEWTSQVYELTVRNPAITRSRLIAAGVPPGVVDITTAELLSRGLLRVGGALDSWEAIPPDIALPAMAARLDRQAARARAMTTSLTRLFHEVREESPPGGGTEIQLLRSQRDLQNAVATLIAAATREIRAVRDSSPWTAFEFASRNMDTHRERLIGPDGGVIQVRTTYDTEILKLPRAGEVLQVRAASGEEHRFLTGLAFSVIVADDVIAFIDLTSYDSSGAGSLLVRDRRFVLGLRAMTENLWHLATPMATPQSELDRRSAFILSLLAAGANDATIAAQTGVSQRTVERTVKSLMDRLGAATRFQAGVHAARRGWL